MHEITPKKMWSDSEGTSFYTELLEKALQEIPDAGAVIILGPMFKIRTPEENFLLFRQCQKKLESQGAIVFDQIPYTDYVLNNAPFDYQKKFDIFYRGLISSGKIIGAYILPEWEQSEGTKSEIQFCKENNIPITYL